MARQDTYDEGVARRICDALAVKGSLRRVCAEDSTLPCDQTVRRWLAAGNHMLGEETFESAYARSKAAGIEALVEEGLDIADDGSNDWQTGQHGPTVNREVVARSSLRVGYRQWLAERMLPKRYGVLNRTELSGPDGKPVEQSITIATGVPIAPAVDDLV